MIFSHEKTSPESSVGKTETPSKKKKSRPSSKPGSSYKKLKPEASKQISAIQTLDLSPRSSFQKTIDDPQLRLKLLELTPRNPAKEKSEGVQEFIRHVSSFIDKQNPFKDFGVPEKKDKKPPNDGCLKKPVVEQRVKKRLEKKKEGLVESGRKIVVKGSEVKKIDEEKKDESCLEKTLNQIPQKQERSLGTYKSESTEKQTTPNTPVSRRPKEKVSFEQKKLRPSEIPLRKNRPDLKKKTPISLLMQKTISAVESLGSLNCQEMKLCTPIEEVEIREGEYEEIQKPEKTEIVDDDIKLNRCSKTANFPSEVKETSSKSKKLDLEKVKSSSFTVLRTRSDTLHRLESLHRQNLSGKEVPRSSSKLKLLTTKPSFNSLKGKSSKKNLSSRASSKGNKPVLKSKSKKFKSDLRDSSPMLKKSKLSVPVDEGVKSREEKKNEATRLLTPKIRKPIKAETQRTVEPDLEANAISQKSLPEFVLKKESVEKNVRTPTPPPPTPEEKSLMNKTKHDAERSQINAVSETDSPVKNKKTKSPLKDIQLRELVVKGKSINLKNKNVTNNSSDNIKLDIKIEINTKDHLRKNTPKCDWLYLNKQNDTQNKRSGSSNSTEYDALKEDKDASEGGSRKTSRSSSSMKHSPQTKTSSTSLHISKKTRSDAGDRWLLTSDGRFNPPVSFQSKTKPDLKLRSGLTKSYNREIKSTEKKDIFEDSSAVRLKRRNSEPHSFRGFIWKRGDASTLKTNRASISSLTSSLRHLNTDELEDFIFWEAVPQRMTSYWEMSLYHFKRPWSVLSCSVFQDNRRSNTPGQILENLRNGGAINRQEYLRENENMGPKEDIFDVEPYIAQKNMDIKNWLAALNFSTSPSTSADVISEGNFCTQNSLEVPNKSQTTPKRRKVLPGLKFSDKTFGRKPEDKKRYKNSRKWHPDDVGDLMELIRRKSGGFVTTEQFLNPDIPTRPQNVTINFCTYPQSITEDLVPKKSKHSSQKRSAKVSSNSEIPTPSADEVVDVSLEGGVAEEPKIVVAEEEKKGTLGRVFKGDLPAISSVNVWKYLFLITVLLLVVYHFLIERGTDGLKL